MDDLSVMWRSAPVNPVPDAAIQPKPDVPLEVLERRICSLAAPWRRRPAEWLRLIAEFDARKGWAQWGIKSCSHWLSWACSVGPGAAREYVRVATALAAVPALDAAFAKGRLSYSKVRALTRIAGEVDEQVLLQQGLVHSASQLETGGPGLPQGAGHPAGAGDQATGQVGVGRRRDAGAVRPAARGGGGAAGRGVGAARTGAPEPRSDAR